MASNSATLRQPAPSPVLHLLWLRTPLPNFPVRASAADAFTEVLLTDFTAEYFELHLRVLPLRYCSRRPLITAGARSGRQSRRRPATTLASELHHRTVLRTACTAARQFASAGPCLISATRETITTPSPNVYSGRHRFPCAGQIDSRPRPQKGHAAAHSSRGHPLRAAPLRRPRLREHHSFPA